MVVATRWGMSTPRQITPKLGDYEFVPENVQADGSLLIAHIAGSSHHGSLRRAVIRRSTDGGATWSVVLNLQGGAGQLWANESVVCLPDGTLLALMSRSVTHDHIEFVRMHRSDDHGETWVPIGPDYPWCQAATFGNLVQLSDGSLLTPWHGDPAGGGWGMARFDPDGLNGTIWSTANGGHWMMEGRLLALDGGNVLGMGRMNGAGSGEGLKLFKSTDLGQTWEQGQGTGLGDWSEGFTVAGDLLTMVTVDRLSGLMELREASVLELWDDPTAWSTPLYLTTLSGPTLWDRGYPDLTTLDSGDIFLTYYAGHKRPSIFAALLSTSAGSLRAADRLAIGRQGFQALAAAVTVTGTEAPGIHLHAANVNLFEEMGQRGKVYLRVTGRAKVAAGVTPPVTVRLTLGAQGAATVVVPVVTLDIPIPTTGEYGADSGWIPVPDDYTGASTDRLGQWSQLTLRGYIVAGDGPVTIQQATTLEIGAQQ